MTRDYILQILIGSDDDMSRKIFVDMRFTWLLNLTPLFKATGYEGYDMTVCVCVYVEILKDVFGGARMLSYAVRRVLARV